MKISDDYLVRLAAGLELRGSGTWKAPQWTAADASYWAEEGTCRRCRAEMQIGEPYASLPGRFISNVQRRQP